MDELKLKFIKMKWKRPSEELPAVGAFNLPGTRWLLIRVEGELNPIRAMYVKFEDGTEGFGSWEHGEIPFGKIKAEVLFWSE